MNIQRRQLLKLGALLLAFPRMALAQAPLRILILGGTGFLGPHQVQAALARGHKVTVFNRGLTAPNALPAGVETLLGDRETGNLEALRSRTWDAVIDNCRDSPKWVEDSTRLLQGKAGKYLYVSSISAYADPSLIGLVETSALNAEPAPGKEKEPGAYGGAKAKCERLTREAFPDSFIIARPGLLVGPGDATDRFTYWPVRLARGGEVLAPGGPDDATGWIDARDAADWMVTALEQSTLGIYNLAGPSPGTTMGQFLDTARAETGDAAVLTWVDAAFLEARGVEGWSDLPCWTALGSAGQGFTRIDISEALAAGLRFRPMTETIADTLAWYNSEPRGELKAGLSAERERTILEAWQAHLSRG